MISLVRTYEYEESFVNGITIRGVQFDHPVMNAAGMVKSADELATVIRSSSSAALFGTLTGQLRPGNDEPRFAFDDDRQFSINAMGLPDRGPSYYGDGESSPWGDIFSEASTSDKPIILSVAPLGDFKSSMDCLIGWANAWSVDIIELNLGCPNVWGLDGIQKRIASFDLDGMMRQIEYLASIWAGPIWLKLSPYSDPVQLQETAAFFAHLEPGLRSRLVVVTSNTFPNGMLMAARGKPYLSVRYGGFAGPAFKAIALGQVTQWVEALVGTEIPVIGVGGVKTGQDVVDYLSAGAVAVQIGTHFYLNGARVFHQVLQEYANLI